VKILLLALAGGCGTLARYGVYTLTAGWDRTTGFPWGTLTVNLLGSAALGFISTWASERLPTAELRLYAGMGFLGAFTTFSTFEFDTLRLLEGRTLGKAGLYVAANLLIGFVAVAGGRYLALRFGPSPTMAR
jgi:CrcB protein